ncbi:MAG TPA: metallophosphoesterase [Pirellulaceae bacterium]|nr:metallophosphoesterase [Pirellulaceae bacterium]
MDCLPDGMSAIIATGDLQGRECFRNEGGPPRLLGEVLPLQLVDNILPQLSLANGRIGVFLAGDFYTVPTLDKRGGSGDVCDVWRAFGDQFDWVVGIAGNHDTFGPDPNATPRFSGKLHYLDHSCVRIDGLNVAGLGGIIGAPNRMRRRTEDDFLRAIEDLLEEQPDILLMHDGPDAPSHGYRGSPLVRQLIELLRPALVVRGHVHWNEPFVELDGGVQVLNVDARVVILRERGR